MDLRQADKLQGVAYDVRGPLLDEAARMEAEGTGSSSSTSATRRRSASRRRRRSCRPSPATCRPRRATASRRGCISARTAVEQYYQLQGIDGVGVDDIYLGNGVSELISMTPAGPAQRRRRGADPVAGLPAVDRGHQPVWRPGRALPLRRAGRLAARPRRPRRPRSATAPGRSSSSTPTTRPVRSIRGRCSRRSSSSPASTIWSSSPTRSTTRSSTTTRRTPCSRRSRRTCSA